MNMPLIAAHRGGAILWPENSLMAFRNALALPIEQVECDVHLNAADEVLVQHDQVLERTTDGMGLVRSLPKGVRHRVRGTGGEAMPTLEELVALVAPTGKGLRLEIKSDATGRPYPGIMAKVLPILDAAGMRQRVALMSFQPETVAEAAAAGGFASVVFLLETVAWNGMGAGLVATVAKSLGATELGLDIQVLNHESVATLRQAGLGVSCWRSNHEATLRQAFTVGLDAITTDDPVMALRLRQELAVA